MIEHMSHKLKVLIDGDVLVFFLCCHSVSHVDHNILMSVVLVTCSGMTSLATFFLTRELWSTGAGLFAACFIAIGESELTLKVNLQWRECESEPFF